MNTKLILLSVLLGFVIPSQIFAQAPDFTGTWVLNLEKSKLEELSKGQTGSVFVIKQEGDKFNLKINHLFGTKKKKFGFKMTADEKTRGVKVLFKGKLERREDGLQASLWRKNFSNIVNYRFGVNENEFVADEIFTSSTKKHHNIWVFDRKIPE